MLILISVVLKDKYILNNFKKLNYTTIRSNFEWKRLYGLTSFIIYIVRECFIVRFMFHLPSILFINSVLNKYSEKAHLTNNCVHIYPVF